MRCEVYSDLVEGAREISRSVYPQASSEKHSAFANALLKISTGWLGVSDGATVRERAAVSLYCGVDLPYDEVLFRLLDRDGPIFGELTEIHLKCWEEGYCSGDEEEDLRELRKFCHLRKDVGSYCF